jgi:predicted ribosomally synthesized peptide with SipW-like signal peptide
MESRDQAFTTDDRRRRRRGLLVVLLIGSSIATLGASSMSLALFTDSDVTTGDFSTGSIDLTLDDATVFAVTGMMPGDTVSSTLNVANSGTAQLRYAMTTAELVDAVDLGSQLDLTIRPGACPSVAAALYGPADLDNGAIGNPAPGDQGSDRVLNAGANENLCFTASLPGSTNDTYEGASVSVEFTFASEQTANN